MLAEDGTPHTAHTTAPVPFALFDADPTRGLRQAEGRPAALCDIAPTLLDAVGLEAPAQMTGQSLMNFNVG